MSHQGPSLPGLVQVLPYDAHWPEIYAHESALIRTALGADCLGVEHIGSTAVPGLSAKPIVDIMVGTAEGAPDSRCVLALKHSGYDSVGPDGRRPGRWMFQKRGATDCNLSTVLYLGALWHDNIVFREFLRSDRASADRYADAKSQAAASATSAQEYQDLKRGVVDEIKDQARAWATSPSPPHSRPGTECGHM